MAVADSIAVSEVSVLPLSVRSAVAKLSAALGPRGTAQWPLEVLCRGSEGSSSTASLPFPSSQQTGLAASCEGEQYSLQIRCVSGWSIVISLL